MIRELNQARLKCNIVDQPVSTPHAFVHHYNSTTKHIDSFLNIPLLSDQDHILDVANRRLEGGEFCAF